MTTDDGALLEVEGLTKSYRMGRSTLEVLRGIDLELRRGEILAVVGQSGSGKSTLLHHIGLLDDPDRGRVVFEGRELPLRGPAAAYARSRVFGFVFQFYHLMPEFSALENVLMPAYVAEGMGTWRRRKRELRARGEELLRGMGLADRMRHKPSELSGGERQRVALARALMNAPQVLLCDEPTGNLDRHTATGVRDLLWDLNRRDRQSIILVTHDQELASRADRRLLLVDGRLENA